ncbi:Exopolyphosphatase [Ophidiomyces ophidiicola]|uniref:Exopolyphosphatase n=1 Tax=Ophidiomyces ophidiicola TaxID=1387563 RepID=UPI0020C5B28D|nr:Exopolyphosphatase [Ophidiomyces ophidiicola]KAI1952637.1 Exopolyphosphatase [Ophidiomyces ophidiicola]KAI2061480.1 Exopolyphosphatase [Ophidiomyces ophidiicola]KAI2090731.1 Exopolyphosphatase [Ophidiomyces ophidiicola]
MAARTFQPLSLLQFLRHATHHSMTNQTTYVLGNPSADLDSIISAILFSYFSASNPQRESNISHQYVPVINLPNVPSGRALGKLRPEFVTALRLATNETGQDDEELLKKNILTLASLKEQLHSSDKPPKPAQPINVFMTDWNALSAFANGTRGIEGISGTISVKGCIDHHEDEKFVPLDVGLRCIQTGVGSCTSLVVRELQSRGLWEDSRFRDAALSEKADPPPETYESQVAKLALAAILADTVNMTAKDKVSEVDRRAVSFLENKIRQAEDTVWDRNDFYEQIIQAKNASVDNLTINEVLGRDYKDWIDQIIRPVSSNQSMSVKTGICSVVRSLSWLFVKSTEENGTHGASQSPVGSFLYSLHNFALSRNLDVVAVMTAYNSQPGDKFHRELLLYVPNDAYIQHLATFKALATDALGLKMKMGKQYQAPNSLAAFQPRTPLLVHVWDQENVSKSRKQVAPLLRSIMTGAQ